MRRKRWIYSCFFGIFVLAVNPRPAWAQVPTAAIIGNVEDATGAAVSGATITVKSLESGATRVVITGDAGNFRVLSLPVGPQEVKAEKKGFQIARAQINLQVGQEAVVNLVLELAGPDLIMQVLGEGPIVNVTPASVSGIVDERSKSRTCR